MHSLTHSLTHAMARGRALRVRAKLWWKHQRECSEATVRQKQQQQLNCLHHGLEVLNNPVPPPSPCSVAAR
jgi:hypothetical protein